MSDHVDFALRMSNGCVFVFSPEDQGIGFDDFTKKYLSAKFIRITDKTWIQTSQIVSIQISQWRDEE